MRTPLKQIRSTSAFILPLSLLSPALASDARGLVQPNIEYMNTDVLQLIAYVLLALGISFLCSVAEAVLLSVTPSYIESVKEKRPKRAALLKRLKQEKVDQALAAILTLNTIAHTVGAIGAGAKAAVVFGSYWFGLFSAGMTFMILFLSEIIPKTIGAVYWSKLTGPTALFVRMLMVILYPVVWISEKLTRFIARRKDLHVFSREEFVAMAKIGEHTGHIQKSESRIIRNLFRFDSIRITDIMTPRTVISAFPEEMSAVDALKHVTQTPFSRIPIYGADMDDITGFVLKDDVLVLNAQGQGDKKLKSLKRGILAVPDLISLSALFEQFFRDSQHIAVIVDEHGGTEGLVTLEDLIETLMGMEIVDETDNVENMRALARKKWVERAKALGIDSEIALQIKTEQDASPDAGKPRR
jgi:CBS domain containing-hemolysin-like protein